MLIKILHMKDESHNLLHFLIIKVCDQIMTKFEYLVN